jgi:hypothetical protein
MCSNEVPRVEDVMRAKVSCKEILNQGIRLT